MFSGKRILFVESYPHVMFGQQHTLEALLEKSRELSIEPVVAVTVQGVFTERVREQGYETHIFAYPDSLSSYGGAIYGYRGMKALKMVKELLGYVTNIRKQLKDLKVQAVYCNDMRGLLTVGVAAKSLGLPIMIWDKLDKPHGWMDWVQLPIVSKNLIISDAVRVKYPKWQQSLFTKKIQKVYNGAKLDRFAGIKPVRDALGLQPEHIAIAIVGSITHRKGHDRVLNVFPKLAEQFPQLRLLIVGDVSGSQDDSAFLNSLKNIDHPQIIRTGFRNDMPEVMQSIDVLLIPSRHEGMGQVTVQAMACGKPVIGSNTGGIPEVVDHGHTGFVFDTETELAEQITRLCQDAQLRQSMGKAGLERTYQYFDRDQQMEKVVNELVSLTH